MARREAERFASRARAHCKVGQRRERAIIYDVSTAGCMLQTCAGLARSGARITLTLDHHTEIHGQVVWAKNRNAGVQFDAPLLPKRVAHLASDRRILCIYPLGSWLTLPSNRTARGPGLAPLLASASATIDRSLLPLSLSAAMVIYSLVILAWSQLSR
jgi:hypothetical protein